MSAVSNLTYVTLHDGNSGTPEYASSTSVFSNYNEAMSYARWASANYHYATQNYVYVWNYNGGSGRWKTGVWTELSNENWPV